LAAWFTNDRLNSRHLWLLVSSYAVIFGLLSQIALLWATSLYYSLWFPAAGLRFALLWFFGPRLTPLLAIAELAALGAIGRYDFDGTDDVLMIASILGPPISYGLAIGLVRWLFAPQSGTPRVLSLQLGAAALIAPLLALLSSIPWQAGFWKFGPGDLPDKALATLVFLLGDILGITLIAPPMLVVLNLVFGGDRKRVDSWRPMLLECGIVTVVTAALVLSWSLLGQGVRPEPMLPGVVWIGLRFGKAAAWLAFASVAIVMLPITSGLIDPAARINSHLMIAAIASLGYLAGSLSDVDRQTREGLARRDRMILQAERLKTLRAMSVAIIHELSQPLSTLSIETRYLAQLASNHDSDREEIRDVSDLVARKARNLSTLLRRLRSFGNRTDRIDADVSARELIENVIGVVAAEAKLAGARLEIRIEDGLVVHGQDVELQQALINLLRNAVAASPGETVNVTAGMAQRDRVKLEVFNRPAPSAPAYRGMGVGKLIVEAIVDLHGGSFMEELTETGDWRTTLLLPGSRTARGARVGG